MNAISHLKGGIVFGLWSLTLGGLVITDKTRLFLRPEFSWLLGAGALIALGFMVASVRRPTRVPTLRALILLLPLLHILMTDSHLSEDVFRNRFLGATTPQASAPPTVSTPTVSTPEGTSPTEDDGRPVPDEIIGRTFAGVEDEHFTADLPVTILDVLRNPEVHHGREVALIGLLYTGQDLERHFGPGRNVALYRFVIACCAADALPVSVAVETQTPPDLPPEQWVRVRGIFELLTFNGKAVPLIHSAQITPIDQPTDPYLY